MNRFCKYYLYHFVQIPEQTVLLSVSGGAFKRVRWGGGFSPFLLMCQGTMETYHRHRTGLFNSFEKAGKWRWELWKYWTVSWCCWKCCQILQSLPAVYSFHLPATWSQIHLISPRLSVALGSGYCFLLWMKALVLAWITEMYCKWIEGGIATWKYVHLGFKCGISHDPQVVVVE